MRTIKFPKDSSVSYITPTKLLLIEDEPAILFYTHGDMNDIEIEGSVFFDPKTGEIVPE